MKNLIYTNRKIILLTGIFVFLYFFGYSQSGKVPPFRMVQSDGTLFKAEDLPFEKPIIIIYFSPDCEDCQYMVNDLKSKIDKFEKASIVMITYYSPDILKEFVSRNQLKNYSNIYAGTEGNSLFVRNYYDILKLPFLALFTKNGDLVKTYNEENCLDDLSSRLSKL